MAPVTNQMLNVRWGENGIAGLPSENTTKSARHESSAAYFGMAVPRSVHCGTTDIPVPKQRCVFENDGAVYHAVDGKGGEDPAGRVLLRTASSHRYSLKWPRVCMKAPQINKTK